MSLSCVLVHNCRAPQVLLSQVLLLLTSLPAAAAFLRDSAADAAFSASAGVRAVLAAAEAGRHVPPGVMEQVR